ncbi:hypothetical protein BJY24_005002 [Nocardia transvalensis]|uniref:Uncharacterized protein n=1 Tax=Nocardia transvalensis TaxID=37333 RepID=A0A7W9PHM8_9NOCA|nr:hypothetical protein [Nocardia transvalensis]MBB5916090.1 hypothetical protein [Nocardia transvalensis]
MTRIAHFVGSLPPDIATDDRAALRWFLSRSTGSPVDAIPRDLDSDWILDYIRARAHHSDTLELVRPGVFADYSDFPAYRVRRGQTLLPEHVGMDRADRIGEIVSAFEELRKEYPLDSGTRLQISQPNPLDMAMFVFAGAAVASGLPTARALRHSAAVFGAVRRLPVFVDAVVREMAAVSARHRNIVWQIETPIAMLAMVKAEQLHAARVLGPLLARQLASLLARTNAAGLETVLHLCYGDYQHASLLAPTSLAPATRLLNAVAARLPERRIPLPAVHIPCGYGAEPAPLTDEFYRPLNALDPRWQPIAGVVSPDIDHSAQALALFENALGRPAHGVATACGFGRCTPETADNAATATLTTARARPAARPRDIAG